MLTKLGSAFLLVAVAQISTAEPNPPQWPPSVSVFGPDDTHIQEQVDAAFAENGGHIPENHGQFSDKRFSFLFKPGSYTEEVPVGFYTTVHGLGKSPTDVIFQSERGVFSEEGSYDFTVGALDSFWRGAENFRSSASWSTSGGTGMLWAVSQAAPLRRIVVDHDLMLYEYQPPASAAGYSSGGYMANVQVGSQADIATLPSEAPLEGGSCPASAAGQSVAGHTVATDCCGLQASDCCARIGQHPGAVAAVLLPANGTCLYKSSAAPLEPHSGAVTLTLPPAPPPAPPQGSGTVWSGSQQQWFGRNCQITAWQGGVWNMVLVGDEGKLPVSHCSNTDKWPITRVDAAPLIAEKPFITIDTTGKYSLMVPDVRENASGTDWESGREVPFEQVYVTKLTDGADEINAKLSAGLDVVVSPGIYKIDKPLKLQHPGQVLLGLGLATLIASNANTVIEVGNVDGVRIAGLLVQAGPPVDGRMSPSLVKFGDGSHPGSAAAPSVMQDLFVRVGGPDGSLADPVAADVMVSVQSGHVIGDNLWLWRADHAVNATPVSAESNYCRLGIEVTGDDVIMYGLAVEHALGDQMQWSGERGRTFMFQSEMPYGVNQEQYGDHGYTGYRVNSTVSDHAAWGVGVYTFFRDHAVEVQSGIVCPKDLEARFVAPLSVHLNGNGTMNHVINDQGNSTSVDNPVSYVC